MFTNLSIKARNIILACVVILGLTAIHSTAKFFNDKEKELLHLRVDITTLKEDILNLRKHEKDFLMRNDLKYEKALLESASKLSAKLGTIAKTADTLGIQSTEIIRLQEVITTYTTVFNEVVAQKKKLGLSPEEG